jgi:hypothetical protein
MKPSVLLKKELPARRRVLFALTLVLGNLLTVSAASGNGLNQTAVPTHSAGPKTSSGVTTNPAIVNGIRSHQNSVRLRIQRQKSAFPPPTAGNKSSLGSSNSRLPARKK